MGLYFGSGEKVKINVNNITCCFKLFTTAPIVNGVLLKLADGSVLKDANGLYLTAKESE